MRVVQAMFKDAGSKEGVDNNFSDKFSVKVGVHQSSVVSSLLFIIVLQTTTENFKTRCLWEVLYVDDLILIAAFIGEFYWKFQA